MDAGSENIVVYNDYVKEQLKNRHVIDDPGLFYAQIFFELANTPRVGYRQGSAIVSVAQDVDANDTTGGIVWESAYLLLDYLLALSCQMDKLKQSHQSIKMIDLGAGVGLLGLVLSCVGMFDVTLTEYDDETSSISPTSDSVVSSGVYALLEANVKAHNYEKRQGLLTGKEVTVHRLDWTKPFEETPACWDATKATDHKYDLVVGTDVVFTPSLVRPLLRTAASLTESSGRCVLCMQIRCAESHELLLTCASEYFDCVTDISEEVYCTEGCDWGRAMECLVFELKGPRVVDDSLIMRGLDSLRPALDDEGRPSDKKRKASDGADSQSPGVDSGAAVIDTRWRRRKEEAGGVGSSGIGPSNAGNSIE